MRGILISMLVFGLCINVYAEEKNEAANWDTIDNRLFIELKAQHKLTDAQTYELMGRTHLQEDRWERAEVYFKKAVKLDAGLYFSWYHIGLIHADNPKQYFSKAIEANPNFALPYYWLGMYYKQCDKKTEAVTYFKKYLERVDRDDPQEHGRIKVAENEIEK
jgi:tetratricopeptide (TPR) repeat protein